MQILGTNLYPVNNLLSTGKISRKVHFSGNDRYESSNSKELNKLYPEGVKNITLEQANMGNCQLLAVIDNLSRNEDGANLLKNLIKTKSNKEYEVIFPGHTDMPILVNKKQLEFNTQAKVLIKLGLIRPANRPPAVDIIEIAYAKLTQQLNPEKFNHIPDNKLGLIYNDPNYHSSASKVMKDITGWKVVDNFANESLKAKCGSFSEEEKNFPGLSNKTTEYLNNLAKEPDKHLITVCTKTGNNDYLDKNKKFAKFHEYSVRNINPAEKTLILANPHNTENTMKISYNEFLNYFNLITVANIP